MIRFSLYPHLLIALCLCSVLNAEVRIFEEGENPSVEWVVDGETAFAYTFDRPQHIYAAQPSLSGDFFMIWHMDFSPRTLKIFRVADGEKIADLAPGFGGAMLWTKGDLLLHAWGCGTNCQSVQVISPQGVVLRSETVSGHALTPHGFYLVFPSLAAATNQDLVRVDAVTGERTTLIPSIPHPPLDLRVENSILYVDFGGNDLRQIPL